MDTVTMQAPVGMHVYLNTYGDIMWVAKYTHGLYNKLRSRVCVWLTLDSGTIAKPITVKRWIWQPNQEEMSNSHAFSIYGDDFSIWASSPVKALLELPNTTEACERLPKCLTPLPFEQCWISHPYPSRYIAIKQLVHKKIIDELVYAHVFGLQHELEYEDD